MTRQPKVRAGKVNENDLASTHQWAAGFRLEFLQTKYASMLSSDVLSISEADMRTALVPLGGNKYPAIIARNQQERGNALDLFQTEAWSPAKGSWEEMEWTRAIASLEVGGDRLVNNGERPDVFASALIIETLEASETGYPDMIRVMAKISGTVTAQCIYRDFATCELSFLSDRMPFAPVDTLLYGGELDDKALSTVAAAYVMMLLWDVWGPGERRIFRAYKNHPREFLVDHISEVASHYRASANGIKDKKRRVMNAKNGGLARYAGTLEQRAKMLAKEFFLTNRQVLNQKQLRDKIRNLPIPLDAGGTAPLLRIGGRGIVEDRTIGHWLTQFRSELPNNKPT